MEHKARTVIYSVFAGVLALAIVVRLFMMQIVTGDTFFQMAQNRQLRTSVIKAPRGDILDRYGRPLVTNKTGYCLQIEKTSLSSEDLNDMLSRLIGMIWQYSDAQITDSFPVRTDPLSFTFSDEESDPEKAKAAELKWKESSVVKPGSDADPQTVLDKYKERYKVSDTYGPALVRSIVGVRYEMEQRGFSAKTPYTLVSDINMGLVTRIKESQADFEGVTVTSEYMRQYADGSLAAHILGRVGTISQNEYETLRNQGYGMNDTVGKQGVEKILEDQLRGTDGKSNVIQSGSGQESTTNVVEPVPGNYAVLTIDAQIQKALEESMAETITNIREKGGDPSAKSGGDANTGAAVVMDVNNGDVLAMATYPTYDPSKFNEQYQELLKNPYNPMWNRAIGGTYPPGSTFKMLTSIAALESGAITPNTTIYDEGVYRFYKDYQPVCWIWKERHTTHGNQNVSGALANSCNYFFYEAGRLTGINTMNDYAKRFGLGEYTGIELSSEESKGRLAGPEDRAKYNLGEWMGGDTLQAAIGQSENLFTPIQLANYIATIANGGTRYKPHIIKAVRSATENKIVQETEPEVLNTIDLKPENLQAVKQGMLDVTENGTAHSAFLGYQIKVGGKTGTAQVPTGSDNGVFVAFAPYDNPQLAIAVVIEHGSEGSAVTPIVKAVFDQYFLKGFTGSDQVRSGELLR